MNKGKWKLEKRAHDSGVPQEQVQNWYYSPRSSIGPTEGLLKRVDPVQGARGKGATIPS